VVFAPSLWKRGTPVRRDINGAMRPARPERVVSMFPRYLFVRLNLADPSWYGIARLDGVEYVMTSTGPASGAPGVPIAVPDLAIDWIRALPGFADNGCLYPVGHLDAPGGMPPIPVGAEVLFLGSAFVDRTAVCEWSDGQRVRLLYEIMGHTVKIMAPRDMVVES
jgi:transcription antitermination factor NusG